MKEGLLIDLKWTIVPGNSAFVVPFDTTRGPQGLVYSSLAAGAAGLAPGLQRGLYSGAIWRVSVRCTGQNVTFDPQDLTGDAGTSADWETQAATGIPATVTAGTTSVFEFKPLTGDSRILITAGATGPTTLVVRCTLLRSTTYGG